jgi:hypothetical protein
VRIDSLPAGRHGRADIWVTNWLACAVIDDLDDLDHLFE